MIHKSNEVMLLTCVSGGGFVHTACNYFVRLIESYDIAKRD